MRKLVRDKVFKLVLITFELCCTQYHENTLCLYLICDCSRNS